MGGWRSWIFSQDLAVRPSENQPVYQEAISWVELCCVSFDLGVTMLHCVTSWFLFPNWLPNFVIVFNALNNHTSVIFTQLWFIKPIKIKVLSNTLKGFSFFPLFWYSRSDQISGTGILHIYTSIQDADI